MVSAADVHSESFGGEKSKFPISYNFFIVAGTQKAVGGGRGAGCLLKLGLGREQEKSPLSSHFAKGAGVLRFVRARVLAS